MDKDTQQVIDDFKTRICVFNTKFETTNDRNVFKYLKTGKYYHINYNIEVGEPPHFINDYTINNIYEVEPYETKTIAYRKISNE